VNLPTEWLAIRAFVLVRASHICEGCGRAQADEVHHRQPRGSGGVHRAGARAANSPSNLIALCLACHRFAEDHRTEAERVGWIVRHGYNPPIVPAKIWTVNGPGWYYLLGDLTYLWCDEHAAVSTMRKLYDRT
jgi:hypothetical protein